MDFTKTEIATYIRRALDNAKGDNLERATAAFRNCTPEQMQQEYGQSGETRQAILDGYKAARELHNAAVAVMDEVLAPSPDFSHN